MSSLFGRLSAVFRRRAVRLEYSPRLDGDPDPGEVVWTWVPYEDDPSQGKDRPVAIIGRRGRFLVGVPLTSKDRRQDHGDHAGQWQVAIGAGPWDHSGRPSFAKIDRVLDIVPEQVRREGAVLPKATYDAIVAGVARAHRAAGR